ncbi:autotransporter outer membrane beta-barrel domain-containing protein [Halomonas sp. HL-93]|uniref:autotransporter outer membrane beta-barrel domain-containing protein n=1 Tax=Halomonas sp. HL-93 TaxID=1666906 RepID=UPI0007F16482|nr:autotransporter outer membrane beta-barrel domain-containing protein [Halomonas sp. HL-93]SBR50231.1 Autotransporter beta-domain-containing protein [Halomonas sp. HL-93]
MQIFFSRFRPTLLASACAAAAFSAHADELTEFTLEDDHTFEGSMSLNWFNFNSSNMGEGDIGSGDNSFNFIAQELDVQATGSYLMGQSEAPVDTVMLVYRGIFDPEQPGTGYITGNDDYGTLIDNASIEVDLEELGLVPVSCSDAEPNPDFCPGLSVELDDGERYTVVISTYSQDDPLGYPQSFFVYGPGFVVVVGEDGNLEVIVDDEDPVVDNAVFEVPVEGSRNQPSGAYFDRVVRDLGLNDPNSPVLNALATQASLNETQRARFVESMSSNVSRNGVRDASLSANRSTLNTLNKRFASTGMGGQMGANLNLTNTLASQTAHQQMEGWQALGGHQDDASVLRYGDHESVDGLIGVASKLSHQGESSPGQFSSWAEGYVSRGSGSDYDFRQYGMLLGMDRWLSDEWLAGLFLGVGQGRVNGDDAAQASTDIDSTSVGAYTAWRRDAVILDATLLAGFADNEHRREIAGVTTGIVEGDNRSENVTLALGASYVIEMDANWELVPNAQLMHSWLHQTAYSEQGDSALAMEYGSQRQDVWNTSVGVDSGLLMRRTDDTAVHLTAGLAWGMRSQSGGAVQTALGGNTGNDGFVISPDNRTVHSADVSTGLSWEREISGNSSLAISGEYEGSFSGHETEHGARLAAAYRW